jgi:hypothetical protein
VRENTQKKQRGDTGGKPFSPPVHAQPIKPLKQARPSNPPETKKSKTKSKNKRGAARRGAARRRRRASRMVASGG